MSQPTKRQPTKRLSISFPVWPKWNYHFPERDVDPIVAVKYWPANQPLAIAGPDTEATQLQPAEYPLELVRLTCGANGVSGITFKEKHNLPALATRPDAVTIIYDAPDAAQ